MTTAVIVKHVEIEGPGLLEDMLKEEEIDYHIVDATAQAIPKADILVLMGGPMSANDSSLPWLQNELDLIGKHAMSGKPYFGVCLGAQLLAKAIGGNIAKAKAREVGNYRVQLTEKAVKDLVFKGLSVELDVFQWHGEAVKTLPRNASVLATGNGMTQAFRFANAYGLQFHLEPTAEMVEQWVRADPEYLKGVPTTPERIHSEFARNRQSYAIALGSLFGRFLEMAQESAARKQAKA